jgi:RNA-directed DNA polymerase
MQFTETQLDAAYTWLCQRRRHYPVHADVWHLRFHWAREKAYLLKLLNTQRYQFEPLQVVQRADGEVLHLWSARDALVLKALSLLLAEVLPVSSACTHVKGHGGLKATVRKVYDELPNYRFVLRTDVKEYYASMVECFCGTHHRQHPARLSGSCRRAKRSPFEANSEELFQLLSSLAHTSVARNG